MRWYVPRIQLVLLTVVIVLLILTLLVPMAPRLAGAGEVRSGSGDPAFPVMIGSEDVGTGR